MADLPLDFLLHCSKRTREDFELNRLNLVAELRKQIIVTRDAMNQADAEARFARYLNEHWDELLEFGRTGALQTALDFRKRIAAD